METQEAERPGPVRTLIRPLSMARGGPRVATDSTYATGPRSHFLDDLGLQTNGVRCVDPAAYTTGKSKAQQESARKFLEDAGVTSVGERHLVEATLKSNYASDTRTLHQREYLAHIRKFIKLLDEDPSCASLLSTFPLFMGKDNKWHKPSDIYLDAPYLDTGLGEYLSILSTSNQLSPLADFYKSLPIDTPKIARFAEKLGCLTRITVTETSCSNNPQWAYLRSVSGERYTSPINRDYAIDRFHLLVARKSEKLARLVWNTLCSLPDAGHGYDATYLENPLRALYRKNERGVAANLCGRYTLAQNYCRTDLPSIRVGLVSRRFSSARAFSCRMLGCKQKPLQPSSTNASSRKLPRLSVLTTLKRRESLRRFR